MRSEPIVGGMYYFLSTRAVGNSCHIERRANDQDGVIRCCLYQTNRERHPLSACKCPRMPSTQCRRSSTGLRSRLSTSSFGSSGTRVIYRPTPSCVGSPGSPVRIILGALVFILAEGIPIFNYLIALVGSVCFAPLARSIPGWLWSYDHGHYMKGTVIQRVVYLLHCAPGDPGLLFLVGAMYRVIVQISDSYNSGAVGTWRNLLVKGCC
jgi:hypothetical protein